jgi:ribonuclease HI
MDPVVAVYADGGVIGNNPSPIGGTWAYCFVGEGGERLAENSGLLLPSCKALGVLPITNNICEFLAIGKALAALPAGWSGIVYSDSQNAMQRWFDNAACNGLPLEWVRSRRAVKQRLGAVQWEVIQGHPTRSELEAGRGRRGGALVSVHNVWCDEACIAAGLEYAVSLGMAECERLLGKPYRRLVEHRKKEERKEAKLDNQPYEVQPVVAVEAEAPAEAEVYRIPTARGVNTPYTPDYEFPDGDGWQHLRYRDAGRRGAGAAS